MGKILTLARKEVAGYFFSPLGYVIGAIFLCACAFKFAPPPGFWTGSQDFFILVPNQPASLRGLFELMGMGMTVIAPLLTMKIISEEYHSGTIETLMTAPVTDTQVVLGKFLGVFTFYLALLGTTLIFLVLMFIFAQPDIGLVLMGYLGMILLGGAFIAVGVFASTLSRYQLLSVVVGIVILSLFMLVAGRVSVHAPQPWNQVATTLDAMGHMQKFARGIFDTQSVVFFLSLGGGFLFLSVKLLESRRWR
ncbi:MAG: ABC transporter permease subunit [Phycisphaerae bacterium]|nr:ABC transporter permease subunit [Phycisphaerae bacterium]